MAGGPAAATGRRALVGARLGVAAALLLGASALAACDMLSKGPHTDFGKGCVIALKELLRSPATLELVKVSESDWTDNSVEENRENKFSDYNIVIEYDAANAFGTPIRSTMMCDGSRNGTITYLMVGGELQSKETLARLNGLVSAQMR